MSLNLSKAKGLLVKVTAKKHSISKQVKIEKSVLPFEVLFELLLLLLAELVVFFPVLLGRVTVPPSRPNRNSAKRRFSGSLLGRISSLSGGVAVVVGVEAEEAAVDVVVEADVIVFA